MVELALRGLRIGAAGRPLVRCADLSAREGECVGLVGASGSGKTLTLRAILGLLDPRLEVAGDLEVRVGGERLRPFSDGSFPRLRGAVLGYLAQDGRASLDPLLRVGDQVAAVARVSGDPDPVPWLARAGFARPESVLRLWPHELSGGMAQRVALASALARGSRILLADEPTTGLDATIGADILAELRARVDQGLGLVLVTHDVRSLAGIADRVVFVSEGETVEEVTGAALRDGAVDSPAARALVAAARRAPVSSAPAAGGAPAAWRLDGVGKVWRRWPWSNPVPAVDGVDLAVAAGERLALIGESGSGKTTLVRVGLGLVRRDSGRIAVLGEPTERWGAARWRAARRRVQLLVQDPRAMVHPRFPIGLLLEESARLHRPDEDPRRAADHVLALVGLEGRRDARVATLSGGERRRAGVARVLLARPSLVVADEPTSGLDAALKAEILELLDTALGPACALVVITHDLQSVARFARRTVVMAGGRIAEELVPGTPPRHAVTHRMLLAAGLPA